jgi:hypothetical protein
MTEYLVILTVEYPEGHRGMGQTTITRVAQVKPAATRLELYNWARSELPAQVRDGATVFFSAEPNQLGGAS